MATTSKRKGYVLEREAEAILSLVWPDLKRTGSVAYKRNAADLVQEGEGKTICLVATRDKNQPILVTLSATDFVQLMRVENLTTSKVLVQCKKREATWIGRVWRDLVEFSRGG